MNFFTRWRLRRRSRTTEQLLMTVSQDLVTHVAALKTANDSLQGELVSVKAKLAAATQDDPNVVAANADIQAVTDSLNAAIANLNPPAVITAVEELPA